jgi:hypothetical protein
MSSTSELSSFAARLRRFICASTKPVEWAPGDVPAFEQLALELFALQFEQNAPYRRFCEARQARPDSVARWTAIPAVPTAAFKEWDLSCLPVEERTTVFHSSGTTGHQPSRHYHNATSLEVYEAALLAWFGVNCPMANSRWPMADCQTGKPKVRGQWTEGGGRRAGGGWQMAILTPPPAQAPHSSLVHMFEAIRRELGTEESRFVGKVAEDGAWSLELESAVQLLRRASTTERPLLMLGSAFSFVHLLDYLAERGMRFALPPGSWAMETGGYKGRSRSLPKPALHALISQCLGVLPDHIMCEYGMSELSSQAYDCVIAPAGSTQHTARRFHFPQWARVRLISPETGHQVEEGETGLIRVYDLANVYSVMAIQTEDLGARRGDGFELVGRAAEAEARGCSLMAADIKTRLADLPLVKPK